MDILSRSTYLHSAQELSTKYALYYGEVSAHDLELQLGSLLLMQEGVGPNEEVDLGLFLEIIQKIDEFEGCLQSYFSVDRTSDALTPTKSENCHRILDVKVVRNLFWHLIEIKKGEFIGVEETKRRGRVTSRSTVIYNALIRVFLHNDNGVKVERQLMTLANACDRVSELADALLDPVPIPSSKSLQKSFQRTSYRTIAGGDRVVKGFKKESGQLACVFSADKSMKESRRWKSQHDRSKPRP